MSHPTEIDLEAFVATLTLDQLKADWMSYAKEIGRLTAAIKKKHPMIMGPGDGAVDVAIRLVEECQCR